MKFDDVLKALDHHKGDGTWSEIARLTDLHYDTIARIARGALESPGVRNVEKIAQALIYLHPELRVDEETLLAIPPPEKAA